MGHSINGSINVHVQQIPVEKLKQQEDDLSQCIKKKKKKKNPLYLNQLGTLLKYILKNKEKLNLTFETTRY